MKAGASECGGGAVGERRLAQVGDEIVRGLKGA